MKYKYGYTAKNRSNIKGILLVIFGIIVTLILSLFLFKENTVVAKINSMLLKPIELINSSNLGENISSSLQSKKSLIKKNEELQKENDELSLRILEEQKLIDENNSLRSMLDIKNTFQHYNLVLAKIILRSHDSYTETFVIGLGSKDGIKLNQAVIHKEGLVGYISYVSYNQATVTTILDPKTAVSVVIPTVDKPAIITGNLEMKANNTLKMEAVEIGSEISIGDTVYTSGLGNMYPESLPVAKITKIEGKKSDSQRYAICEPLVNMYQIREVAVIIGDDEVE